MRAAASPVTCSLRTPTATAPRRLRICPAAMQPREAGRIT
jgi:hypothetical protein